MSDEKPAAPSAPRLRPARLTDCPALAALAQALLPEAWSEGQLSSEIALPEGRVWVAVGDDGGLIGFVVARRELDELHVLLAGVAPHARRRGVASRLIDALGHCERDLARMHLEVRAGNRGAQAFWEALGFRAVGQRPRHYADGEAALLMVRDLG